MKLYSMYENIYIICDIHVTVSLSCALGPCLFVSREETKSLRE